MIMKATIQKIDVQHSTVSAVTDNSILVVFRVPNLPDVHLGDALDLDLTLLDQSQNVRNSKTQTILPARIQSNDVHDLRLPSGHGTSRFPSLQRRLGET